MSDDDLPMEDYADSAEDDTGWEDADLADRDGGDELLGVVVVNWRDADQDQATEALLELSGWVAWMVARYNLTRQRIPDCWAEHTDLIEELSALHTAWRVAFDQTDGGYGPIGWHERLAAALSRTAFHDRCPAGHRPDTKRVLA